MKKFCLFLIVGLVCSIGAQAITITVSGGVGLQTAIDGASAGDTIEITDSMVYNEDIFIGVPGGGAGKDGITIIGTALNPPTILATNTSLTQGSAPNVAGRGVTGLISGVVSGLLAGDAAIPDQFGLIVEANNCTLTNLIIQNDGPALPGTFTSALSIVGDDTTINDCILRGTDQATPGREDNEFCIGFTSGNWPELDVALGFVGLANYFANGGYPTALAAERTTLNNCTFERSTNAVGAGDYSQFFYNSITAAYLNSVVPFNIVFNNCTWAGGVGDGEVLETGGIDNLVFNDCLFDGNEGVIDLGGGTWVFNNTVFSNSTDERLLRHDAVVEFGGGASYSSFNGCLFCGNAPGEDRIIEIQEGGATFSRCIFNATEDSIMLWDYNNWDGQFLDGSFYPVTTQVVSFDRCDFYRPNGTLPVVRLTGDDTPDAPQPGASLVMTNNIITGTDVGVEITGANLPPGGADLTINNNNFLGTTLLVNFGWTETSVANNLSNVSPGYANAGGCTPADYEYGNSALTSAGTTGGPLGSQDPPSPPGQNVDKWEIYK